MHSAIAVFNLPPRHRRHLTRENALPVTRIEKFDSSGSPTQRAEPDADGQYHYFHFGKNVDAVCFRALDDVAEFLRKPPKAGVRMNPGWSKISRRIYIDGVPR
ncbi:hypothetical protein BjapCC829_12505 [Bradyrhizobium barranii]|uniref:KTSC domain-containing protein n=1 Tax=Bradyrhizobium barranii TaxID=2992140 RepID=A0ABY3QUW0_9BRAD|nr:hypothetical protein [Bradyrhizobium japonicum]UFW89274.1 hypothetical protein BjapCC829_12505 [Bradyrhizobium japonicum]